MVESGGSEKTRNNNKTHEGKKEHKHYGVKGHEGKRKNPSTFSNKRVTNNNNNNNNNNINNKHNNKKGGNRRPGGSTASASAVGETERYVVVITNVENDFAKVHREAIPRYCCLNEQYNRSHPSTSSLSLCAAAADGINSTSSSSSSAAAVVCLNETKTKEMKRRQCRYAVIPRTETRSVEVAVYGKADGDVSSVFLPVRTTANMNNSISTSNTNTNSNNNNDNNSESPNGNNNNNNNNEKKGVNTCKDTATIKDENNEDNALIECVKPPVGNDTLFATLEDMTMALRHKPYFTHPPKFLLNLAGKEDGDVLVQESKRSKRNKAKQQIDNEESEDEDEDDEEEDDDKKKKKKHVKKNDEMEDDSHHLRQTAVRQADMITAVATTSARMSTKDIQYQLRDIPGFITCWMLYPQHFRLVFASKSALFKAKQLLDQFAVDGNVRVALTLGDGAAKEFTAYIAAQEETA